MNHSYRSIWNPSLGAWVAASEHAKARRSGGGRRALVQGSGAGATSLQARIGAWSAGWKPLALAAAISGLGLALPARADLVTVNPGGSIVTDGKTTLAEEYRATSALGMVFTANPNAAAGPSPAGIVLRGFGNAPSTLQNFFTGYGDPATSGTFIQIGDSTYSALGGATTQIFGARLLFGNGTSVTDDDSVAMGTGASTSAAAGIAIGKGAATTGADAIALGSGARATGIGDLAFGRGASASGGGLAAVAIGDGATASERLSVALGKGATAGGYQNVAIGAGATTGIDLLSMAIGPAASAIGNGAMSFGSSAVSNGNNALAVGDNARAVGTKAVAVGSDAVASADFATALGKDAAAGQTNAIAIGNGATAMGVNSISIGTGNNVSGARSGAIGDPTTVTGAGSYSFGNDNTVGADNAFAIGNNIVIAAGLDGAVAIGNNSVVAAAVGTAGATIAGTAYTFAGTTPGSTVSVGAPGAERTLTNVAAGRLSGTSTDAVNGSQLFATNQAITTTAAQLTRYYSVNDGGTPQANYANDGATGLNALAAGVGAQASIGGSVALGAGSSTDRVVAPVSGSIVSGVGFVPYNTTDKTLAGAVSVGNAAGNTYRQIINVADGTQAQDAVTLRQLQGAVGSVSVTSTMYFHANSSAVDSLAVGADSVAVGPTTVVNGDNGIGLGKGAVVQMTAPGGTAIGQAAQVSLADGIALGSNAQANAIQGIAIGAGAQSTFLGSVALGAGSLTTIGAQTGYTAFGLSAAQNSAGEVSIGSAGAERKLTNLAAGSAATDAVNVSQLQALSDNSVRYDDAGKAGVTLGGATSTDGGITGGTKVGNLAQGALSATSTDAVNGSQLFTTNQNLIALGTTVTNLEATVNNFAGDTSSSYTAANGAGIRYARTNETGLAPSDAFAQAQGSTALGYNAIASDANSVALGANSVTAPTIATAGITLGGVVYNFAGAAPTSTVSIGAPGAERTLTNVAAGRVSGSSADAVNGSQLFATNSAMALLGSVAGNSVQYDNAGKTAATLGGPVSTDGGVTGGTRLSNLTQGAVTATSTDAVNGSQLYGVQQQVINIANGAAVKYLHSNSTAPDSVATGVNSMAAGPQAVAVGVGAVAVGNGANAQADGSVALGAGAVASRGAETYTGPYSGAANSTAGTVSVGSAGAERSLVNVADGSQATDAVNLRQLTGAVQQANAYTDTQVSNLSTGRAGLFQGNDSNGLGAPQASGSNSVAGGAGAVASGASSTALGNGAQASGTGSVAIGAGSVATRANTVSVGAAGAERQVVNVAAGTADTDAVNVGQFNQGLKNTLEQANQYTDQKVDALASQVRGIERNANAAAAAAMAVAGLPQPIFAGKGMTSAAISSYQGQSALAVGVSAVSDNGRWVYKLGGSVNSRGKGGAVAAAGFQW